MTKIKLFLIFLSIITSSYDAFCQDISAAELKSYYNDPKGFIKIILQKDYYSTGNDGSSFHHENNSSVSISKVYITTYSKDRDTNISFMSTNIRYYPNDKSQYEYALKDFNKSDESEFFYSDFCDCYIQEYNLDSNLWLSALSYYSELFNAMTYQIYIYDDPTYKNYYFK